MLFSWFGVVNCYSPWCKPKRGLMWCWPAWLAESHFLTEGPKGPQLDVSRCFQCIWTDFCRCFQYFSYFWWRTHWISCCLSLFASAKSALRISSPKCRDMCPVAMCWWVAENAATDPVWEGKPGKPSNQHQHHQHLTVKLWGRNLGDY